MHSYFLARVPRTRNNLCLALCMGARRGQGGHRCIHSCFCYAGIFTVISHYEALFIDISRYAARLIVILFAGSPGGWLRIGGGGGGGQGGWVRDLEEGRSAVECIDAAVQPQTPESSPQNPNPKPQALTTLRDCSVLVRFIVS